MKVLVVGGSGMLGTALVSVLGQNEDLEVYATYRTPWGVGPPEPDAGAKWFRFAGGGFPPAFQLGHGDWIVNAAGAIPQRLNTESVADQVRMVRANTVLPYELAEVCEQVGSRLIHVTTDCVFSGQGTGRSWFNHYKEQATQDARTLYGRSKGLGEILDSPDVFNLRCSIIGPEPQGRAASLLGWFLSQSEGKGVVGYEDHFWNGVTTLALSKVIQAVICNDLDLPPIHHLVPGDSCSKAALLGLIQKHFGHEVKIEPHSVGGVDRTLGTSQRGVNDNLWGVAGYEKPPRIEEMVQELASWVAAGGYLFKEVSQ